MTTLYVCRSCRAKAEKVYRIYGSIARWYGRPSFAPKPILDLKHMRQNPGLYEQNCLDRNFAGAAKNAWRILELHSRLMERQKETLELRRKNNAVGKSLQQQAAAQKKGQGSDTGTAAALLEEARKLKEDLKQFESWEADVVEEMQELALHVPNLSSNDTPVGTEPTLLGYINGQEPRASEVKGARSHVDIGKELDILDFEASATTSGWGWYFLKNEAAMLEQALIQYALEVAMKRGWRVMTPPSLVYEHIASACGFMPRDQNGETQRYEIAQNSADQSPIKSSLVLAGTAEIPLAASQANKTLEAEQLPLKVIGPSRCYRAEAGAHGLDTKGLYRVHEFTKVEMFAWTAPETSQDRDGRFGGGEEEDRQTDFVFEEMLAIQHDIISDLGLHAKILEMPTTDLGAAAARKVDIEAYFPSRTSINGGYGELTSASTCTDFQSRRLNTRVKSVREGKPSFPCTLNGTAIAIPRVLACILENGWNEASRTVRVPKCLQKWMPGQLEQIGPKR